jgi:two-component system, OmpR family, phosphate regulon sensor histidine kinase PhoR
MPAVRYAMRQPVFDTEDSLRRRLKARWYIPAATALATFSLAVAGLLPGIAALGLVAAALLLTLAVRDRAEIPIKAAPAPPPEAGLARWQMMLDGSHGPSLVLDRDDIVIGSNGLADSILPHAQGLPISAVCRAPELLEAIAAAHKSGVQQPCHITKLSAYHGAAVAIVTPLTPQPAARQAALLVALRDLTEQEKLSRMRSDFVANASHELRTPLTSLKGFIETLQGPAKEDAPARERFLAIMHEQAVRMSRLIDDLLSLSRVEMKEHVRPTERVDVVTLFDEVMREAAPAAERAGITLVCTPPAPNANGGVMVTGDRDELRLLLQNLMQNAIKYGRNGGRVELLAGAADGPRLAIHVRDDGIGIDAEHLPRLTERFYRVSTGESRARGGTGLGLAIVKHIVSRHRGEMTIESEPGVGSTFTVKLPRVT